MVYVINKNGHPLMPCSETKARKLLRAGRAKCKRRTPFTIKLTWDCEENVQEVVAGMDTGSKTIGCAAIANGHVVYQCEVQLSDDVSRKMEQRRMFRRNRRGRKTRYRKARWLNRAASRKSGRLAPSIRSKVESHIREKKFVESILPVSFWKVETASFDIHKLSNPEVTRWTYQEGQQKGFYNTKAFILHRDGYKCQKCKTNKGRLHVHHIIFRSNGGTDTPDNLTTLCESCHNKLHGGEFSIKGSKSKTKHATEVGIIKSQLKKLFGTFEETFGYETKFKREQVLEFPKTHYYDAVAICCEDGELVKSSTEVHFKKHVSRGDYKQTRGSHSEQRIPTGKLFGLRKFDLIKTKRGTGFVKGKRTTGSFAISNLEGELIVSSVNIKKNCTRISARSSSLTERRMAHSATGQAHVVTCA